MPSISVIITTFNREKLLKRALNSVVNQSLEVEEIIIINDGDNFNETYLNELFNIDNSNLRVFNSNFSGPNFARKKGFLESKGEYIAFLDDDDQWDKDKLKHQFNFLESNPEYIICTCNFNYSDSLNRNIKKIKLSPKRDIRLSNCIGGFSMPLIRRKYIKEKYFNDIAACQDWNLWLNLSFDYPNFKVKYLNKYLVKYYYSQKNNISSSTEKTIKGYYDFISINRLKFDNSVVRWHLFNYINHKNRSIKRYSIISIIFFFYYEKRVYKEILLDKFSSILNRFII